MVKHDQLLTIIESIHNAALNFSEWEATQEMICQLTGATTSMLGIFDRATYVPSLYSTTNIRQSDWETYEQHYHKYDLWLSYGKSQSIGTVIRGEEIVPDEIFYNGEFYNDFLKYINLKRLISCVVAKDKHNHGFLSLHRSENKGEYSAEDKQVVELLAPHLLNAIAVNLKLQGLESRIRATSNVLNRLPFGIFFIDNHGQVLEMNQSAENMIALNDGLMLHDGQLMASMRNKNSNLSRLILSTASAQPDPLHKSGGHMTIPRPSMKRPWHVQVLPISTEVSNEHLHLRYHTPTAMVIVCDAEKEELLPEDYLKQLYGLTPAEAKLASMIGSGCSLKLVAEKLDISIHTARNQLKRIFHKTNTHRQAELVQLLISSLTTHSNP